MAKQQNAISDQAKGGCARLQTMVADVEADLRAWHGWNLFERLDRAEDLRALLREIMFAAHFIEARIVESGFRMIGRLPASEMRLMQMLCHHRTEVAAASRSASDHYLALGGEPGRLGWPATPAAFAVAAVWDRMAATGDPYGYLGAEFLSAAMTEHLSGPLAVARSASGLSSVRTPVIGVRDKGRRSASLRLLILHTLSDHPETLSAMLYSLALFRSVFPLPLWEEAHLRALSPQNAL